MSSPSTLALALLAIWQSCCALLPAPAVTTRMSTAIVGGGAQPGALLVRIGPGFSDVIPRQIVRTADDRLFVAAGEAQYSPKLNLYSTPRPGLPTSSEAFQLRAQVVETGEVVSVDLAYDGRDLLQMVAILRSGTIRAHAFDLQQGRFSGATTLGGGNPAPAGDYLGSSGVSALFDRSGHLHVAYAAPDDQVAHAVFRPEQDGSLVAIDGPTRVDAGGAASHPVLAIDPSDASLTVAWISEAERPARILARTRQAEGRWGAVEQVSSAPVWVSRSAGLSIDQGPGLLIDQAGRRHLAYIEDYDGTGEYGRLHYVEGSAGRWEDHQLPASYTHDPAPAIRADGSLAILGHGHARTAGCSRPIDLCVWSRQASGDWSASILAQGRDDQGFDASPSVKWSVVGFNRPDLIEFVIFSPSGGDYSQSQLYYGRL